MEFKDRRILRITQVMLSKGLGGGERIFIDLCLSLAEKGHQIQAVCHPEFHGLSLLDNPNVLICPLKVHWDCSLSARSKLIHYMKSFKSQIVHTHMARASMIGGFAGWATKIPVAANMHDYAKLKYYSKVKYFFPGTKDLKRYLVENQVNTDRIIVIPHFSRLDAVASIAEDNHRPDKLISFGRFSPEKGFDLLIEALRILKDRGLLLNLRLGGDGPEKHKLVQLVNKYSLQRQINFSGWVSDVPLFLKEGSIFVLPSLRESFGIAVLEAMSQGKIIIASKTPGPKEILDNSMAHLFAVGDAAALSDCIQEAILNPANSYSRAQNALAHFKANFSVENIIERFGSSYHHILDASA